ncbi:MAG: hypothetical protein HQL65_18645, partial [Magnetococcales bacterium]|nr:hypothetical protein [Magnetococcales bacterium]
SQTLHEVLDAVAVRGTDGEISLEPLLAAVKAEGERVLARQDELVRQALNGAVADLKIAVGSEKLARDLTRTVLEEGKRSRSEQERVVHAVLEGLEGLEGSVSELKETLVTLDPADAIKNESALLDKRLADLKNTIVGLDPVAAIKSESAQLEKHLTGLTERLGVIENRLEPALERLRDQNTALLAAQEQRLRDTLVAEFVRRDPILANLDRTLAEKAPGLDLEPLLAELRQQNSTLLNAQERVLKDLLSAERQHLEPMFAEMQGKLAAEQRHLEPVLSEVREALAADRLNLDPLLAALREQGENLARRQSQTLHEVLDAVAVRGTDGAISLEPLLAAVKAEGLRVGESVRLAEQLTDRLGAMEERFEPLLESLQGQNRVLIEQLDGVERQLAPVLDRLRIQNDALLAAQEQQVRELLVAEFAQRDPLLARLDHALTEKNSAQELEPLLVELRSQNAALFAAQEQVFRDLLETENRNLEPVLAELREALTEDHLNLDPLLAMLREQGENLARRQSQTLHDVLNDVAVRGSDGEVSLEPLLAAVKAEGERVLARQDELIRQAMGQVVSDLKAVLGPEDLVRNLSLTVQAEGKQSRQDQEHLLRETLAGAVSELKETLAETLSATHSMARRGGGEHDVVLEKIQANGKALLEAQKQALEEAVVHLVEALKVAVDPQGIKETVRNESSRLAMQLSQNQEAEQFSLTPVLAVLREQGERQNETLVRILSQNTGGNSSTVENVDTHASWIFEVFRRETRDLLERQADTVQKVFRDALADATPVFPLEEIVRSIQGETRSLVARLDQDRLSVNDLLEPLVATFREEFERLMPDGHRPIGSAMSPPESDGNRIAALEETSAPVLATFQEMSRVILETLERVNLAEIVSSSVRTEYERLLTTSTFGNQPDTLMNAVQERIEMLLTRQTSELRETLSILGQVAPRRATSIETGETFEDVSLAQAVADKISLTPVLRAMENFGQRLAENQFQALQSTLSDMLLRDTELIRDGYERMLALQEQGEASWAQVAEKRLLPPILEALVQQGEYLTQTRTAVLNAFQQQKENDAVQDGNFEPLEQALQERLTHLDQLLGHLPSRLTLEQALEDLRSGMEAHLAQGLSIEAVADLIKTETRHLADRFTEGQTQLHQLLAPLNQELRQAREQWAAEIRTQDETLVHKLIQELSPAPVLGVLQEQQSRMEQLFGRLPSGETLEQALGELRTWLPSGESLEQSLGELRTRIGESLARGLSVEVVTGIVQAETQRLADRFAEGQVRLQQVLEPLVQDLRQVTGQLVEGQSQLQQVLEPLGQDLRQVTGQLVEGQSQLQQVLEPLGRDLRQVNEKLFEEQRRVVDEVVTRQWRTQETLLKAIGQQIQNLAQNQSLVLHEALEKVAVRDVDGTLTLEPILAAVKAEGERLLARQDELLRSQLADNSTDLWQILSQENREILTMLLAESTADVSRILSQESQENRHVVTTLLAGVTTDLHQILGQEKQTVLAALKQALTGVTTDLHQILGQEKQTVLTTLEQALTRVTTDLHQILGQEKQTVLTTLEQALTRVTTDLHQILGQEKRTILTTLEQVLTATAQENQNHLVNILGEMFQQQAAHAVTGPSEQDWQRWESQLLVKQERLLEELLAQDRAAMEPVLAELKEALVQDLALLEPAIANIQTSLSKGQMNMEHLQTALVRSQTEPAHILEQMERHQGELLPAMERLFRDALHREHVAMNTIMDDLRTLFRDFTLSQSRALHDALDSVAVKNIEGKTTLDPVVAVVKAETGRLLLQQRQLIDEALPIALAHAGLSNSREMVAEAFRSEIIHLEERLRHGLERLATHMGPALDSLHQKLELEPLKTVIREESERLARRLSLDLSQEELHKTIRLQGEQLRDQFQESLTRTFSRESLSRMIPLDPLLERLHDQEERLEEIFRGKENKNKDGPDPARQPWRIKGDTLKALLEDMSRFMAVFFERSDERVIANIEDIVSRLKADVPVHDPGMVDLILELSERFSQLIFARNLDINGQVVQELDRGLLKIAHGLQEFTRELMAELSAQSATQRRAKRPKPLREPVPRTVAMTPQESAAVPVVEPATVESAAVPAVEPAAVLVTDPATAPVMESAAVPAVEPATVLVTDPATAPVMESAAVPAVEPATVLVTDPATAPVMESAAVPAVEPATVLVTDPATAPVMESAAVPKSVAVAAPESITGADSTVAEPVPEAARVRRHQPWRIQGESLMDLLENVSGFLATFCGEDEQHIRANIADITSRLHADVPVGDPRVVDLLLELTERFGRMLAERDVSGQVLLELDLGLMKIAHGLQDYSRKLMLELSARSAPSVAHFTPVNSAAPVFSQVAPPELVAMPVNSQVVSPEPAATPVFSHGTSSVPVSVWRESPTLLQKNIDNPDKTGLNSSSRTDQERSFSGSPQKQTSMDSGSKRPVLAKVTSTIQGFVPDPWSKRPAPAVAIATAHNQDTPPATSRIRRLPVTTAPSGPWQAASMTQSTPLQPSRGFAHGSRLRSIGVPTKNTDFTSGSGSGSGTGHGKGLTLLRPESLPPIKGLELNKVIEKLVSGSGGQNTMPHDAVDIPLAARVPKEIKEAFFNSFLMRYK